MNVDAEGFFWVFIYFFLFGGMGQNRFNTLLPLKRWGELFCFFVFFFILPPSETERINLSFSLTTYCFYPSLGRGRGGGGGGGGVRSLGTFLSSGGLWATSLFLFLFLFFLAKSSLLTEGDSVWLFF